MAGRLDVRGGLERVVEAVSRLSLLPSPIERITSPLTVANDQTRARRNVHHHYDLGNDFYQSWLDDQLVYTCAYFEHPDVSLEEAQRAKLDLVCRKLRLQPGETVVEAGCGWGALALHMARAYGVRVKAFNVSREQIAYARERAAREGLAVAGRVHRRRLPERRGGVRRVRVGRHARACRPEALRQPGRACSRACCGARAAAGCSTSSAATSRVR